MYVIVKENHKGDLEYLRDGWTFEDAYTDDLGHTLLFTNLTYAESAQSENEQIGLVEVDEDGGLLFQGILTK